MATKGPSNRYGNAKDGSSGHITTHTGFAWAKSFNKSTLVDHFRRHGEQMGCPTQDSYNAHAVSFANTVDRKNCVSFIDRRGSTYKYNKKSNTLAIITKQGVVVTFFKPKDGYNYYLREKERNQR